MNRRDFIRTTGMGGAAIAIGTALPLPTFARDATTKLTVLHTNDMHSRIEPFPDDGRKYGGTGGMARRAALIRNIREEGNEVLLLDAGDIFQGTPYFNYFGGELEFRLMSEMGYDASTLGNHDFDNGLEGLKRQFPHARFSFINSNYEFSDAFFSQNILRYQIFNKGTIKVGVFGLGIELEGLVLKSLYGNTQYNDPVPVAREMVRLLRDNGCHMVICLSHLGLSYDSDKVSDMKLAEDVPGIDLIIGGHTHTFLSSPVAVGQPDGSQTLINQVGWSGINLGRIDYEFSGTFKKYRPKTASIEISEKSIGK